MTASASRTVLCFGDSNTHGTVPMRFLGDIRRHPADVRWTAHLAAARGTHVTLVEEGHPGRTTVHDDPVEGAHKNGIRVLPALLETHRPVDLVVLMLGTNDLKARFSVTPADIARSIDRLCEVIARSAAGPDLAAPRILIVCPPPIEECGCLGEMFEGGAAKSRRLASLVETVAVDRGAAFLDAGRHIAVSPLDGIHFEAEAHALLGKAIAPMVAAMLSGGGAAATPATREKCNAEGN